MIRIEYKEAISFLLPRHYSGRKPSITYAFGYYEDEVLKAVCTFGKPASNSLCVGVCGKEGQSVPVGVGQPSLKIDEITVGGTD